MGRGVSYLRFDARSRQRHDVKPSIRPDGLTWTRPFIHQFDATDPKTEARKDAESRTLLAQLTAQIDAQFEAELELRNTQRDSAGWVILQ